MTPLGRYVAEEIATDHVDGLLSRREALRRLGLLGLGTAAASALITACAGNRSGSPQASSATSSPPESPAIAPPGMATARPTEPISWDGPRGPLMGSWAPAEDRRGAVLVIHENKGLNDRVRSVAGRLAGIGYSALAVDLLSDEGGTATFTDPAAATAALAAIEPLRFIADLSSALEARRRRPVIRPDSRRSRLRRVEEHRGAGVLRLPRSASDVDRACGEGRTRARRAGQRADRRRRRGSRILQ